MDSIWFQRTTSVSNQLYSQIISNDEKNWEVIDKQSNRDFDIGYIVKTYECKMKREGFFRFVRLVHTGKSTDNDDEFRLCCVEFFGNIKLECIKTQYHE